MTCFDCLIELKKLCQFTDAPEDRIPNPVSLMYFTLMYLIKTEKIAPTDDYNLFFNSVRKIKIKTMLKIFRYMNNISNLEMLSKYHIATELLLESHDNNAEEEFKKKARIMTIDELKEMYKERLLN